MTNTTTKNFSVLEEGYVHTANLSEAEANELCTRLQRCFPDLEFCILQDRHGEHKNF